MITKAQSCPSISQIAIFPLPKINDKARCIVNPTNKLSYSGNNPGIRQRVAASILTHEDPKLLRPEPIKIAETNSQARFGKETVTVAHRSQNSSTLKPTWVLLRHAHPSSGMLTFTSGYSSSCSHP
jgi:hypothetical protein